jgi:hypothetical protein
MITQKIFDFVEIFNNKAKANSEQLEAGSLFNRLSPPANTCLFESVLPVTLPVVNLNEA